MTKHPQALKVVITDDETPARSRVRDLLEDCASSFPIELVGEAASGRELLALLAKTPADVVLLDIRMPEMDGLEAAQHLLKLPDPPSVIFTTAYDDYALKAFELHAVDYLVKPIRLRRLHDALTRARAITPLSLDVLQRIAPEPRKHLSVQERGKVMLIAVSDIRYLRAELKYVTVRTATREHLVEESLRAWSRNSPISSCASIAVAWWRRRISSDSRRMPWSPANRTGPWCSTAWMRNCR